MGLLERLEQQKLTQQEFNNYDEHKKATYNDAFGDVKHRVHSEVVNLMNARAAEKGGNKNNDFSHNPEELLKVIESNVDREAAALTRQDKSRISKEILDEMIGFGPLEPLLNSADITEIMVNGPFQVYVERRGKLELSDVYFRNDEHVMNVIDRIVSTIGRHIDEASPMVDARLPDGSRVNAIIPPLSLVGPVITIRKFAKTPITVQDLAKFGSITPKMISFLEACVKGKLNIMVSGGTGSGKTTLLNVLSGFIPDNERIVTIEDAAELQLRQRHVVTLESRPANLEGRGMITIRDLVRNSLRMRPDRIIVGEVRSGEALDMLQAMNTGHDGSLTTAHANTPRDLLSRLETMVLMAGMELPIKAIREQIASAIDIIVQQTRLRDGSRKVINITEVVGMEGDVITLQDLFVFNNEGIDSNGKLKGNFHATGVRPNFLEKLKGNGVAINNEWFAN